MHAQWLEGGWPLRFGRLEGARPSSKNPITRRNVVTLADYSSIRGVCYGWGGGPATIERDLGYAQRLRLNSSRIWLSYPQYWQDPQPYIAKLRTYIRTAHS